LESGVNSTPPPRARPLCLARFRGWELGNCLEFVRSGMLRLTELASEADLSMPATTRRDDTGGAAKVSLPWRLSSLASLLPCHAPGPRPHEFPPPRPVLTLDHGQEHNGGRGMNSSGDLLGQIFFSTEPFRSSSHTKLCLADFFC
jgi:hypothetical protein